MKKLWKRMAAFCMAGCMAVVMMGCGSAMSESYTPMTTDSAKAEGSYDNLSMNTMGGESYDYEMYEEAPEAAPEEYETTDTGAPVGTGTDSAAKVENGRKLIRTVNLSVETKEFDQLMDTLQEQILKLGGYVENMDTYNGSTYYGYSETKRATIVVRMPKDEMQGFLDTVSGICNIVRRSENVEDVTLAYVDMESRKSALRTEQERLLTFLEQAETIEEIITLEDRLTDVRYELEKMESQLRTYDNKIEYGTIYLDIEEVQELTPVEIEEETAWERIVNGFTANLQDVGDGLTDFGIGLVIRIPYMVVWAVVIGLIVLMIKLIIRGSKKRKQKKLAAQQKLQVQQSEQIQQSEQAQQAMQGQQNSML